MTDHASNAAFRLSGWSRHWIAACCALAAAFASAAAAGQELVTFASSRSLALYQDEPLPPAPPPPLPSPGASPPQLFLEEVESSPRPRSFVAQAAPSQPVVCQPGPWYARWPVIGPLHRRWVTHTKPALQYSHWGYPENFIERPFGSDVVQAEQMQISNGLHDQQVLYHYDFLSTEPAVLSARGRYQLQKIVRRMDIATCPIAIQTSIDDPVLDQARRDHVLATLRAAGVPVEPEMVVVDYPPQPGLQGTEGLLIYGNMLRQTQQQGQAGGGGGGAGALAIPVVGVGTGGR